MNLKSTSAKTTNGRCALFGKLDIFFSQLVGLISQATGHHRAHLIQVFK